MYTLGNFSSSQTCFGSTDDSTYPRVVGDTTGDTKFDCFDMDSSANFIIAGTYYVEAVGLLTPIVLHMNSDGSDKWKIYLSGTNSEITAIKLSSNMVYAVQGKTGSQLQIIKLDDSNGSVNSVFYFTRQYEGTTGTQSLLVSGSYLYMTFQSSSDKLWILVFDHTSSSSTLSPSKLFISEDSSQVSSPTIIESGQHQYITALYQKENRVYYSLIRLKQSSGIEIDKIQGYRDTLYPQSHYIVSSGGDHYHYLGARTSSELYFFRIKKDSSYDTDEKYAFQYSYSNAYIKGMYASSSDEKKLYAFVFSESYRFYLYTVQFSSSSSCSVTIQTLSNYDQKSNTMVQGIFSSSSKAYYIAKTTRLDQYTPSSSTQVTFSYSIGSLMIWPYTDSCLQQAEGTETKNLDEYNENFQNISEDFDEKEDESDYELTRDTSSTQAINFPSSSSISKTFCPSSVTLSSKAINDQTYITADTAITVSFTDFADPYTCTDVTYSLGGNYTDALSIITLSTSSSSKSLKIYTPDGDKEDYYQVVLTAAANNNAVSSASTTFYLNVTNPCKSATLTRNSISLDSQKYYLGLGAKTYDMSQYYTFSNSSCAKKYTMSLSNTSMNTFISIVESTGVITINEDDSTLHDLAVTITYTAEIAKNSLSTDTRSFVVTFSKCLMATLTNTAMLPQTIYYDLGQTSIETMTFEDWTHNYQTDCGTFGDLSFKFENSTQIPSKDTNTLGTKWVKKHSNYTFSVYTTDISQINTHKITASATMSISGDVYTKTFDLVIQTMCVITTTGNSFNTPYVYNINDPAIVISYTDFGTQNTCKPTTIQYDAKLNNGQLTSLITWDKTAKTFTIYSISNLDKGSHTITLIGYIVGSDTGNTYTNSVNISLTVNPYNSAAPKLPTPPVDQTMVAGQVRQYKLGTATDVDGDKITITASNGGASWIKISGSSFTFAPPPSVSGTFAITVTLKDDSPTPLSQIYTFNVKVDAPPAPATQNTTNSSSSSSFMGVLIPTNDPNASPEQRQRYQQLAAQAEKFKLRIDSISTDGVVNITFTETAFVPAINYSMFNNSIMLVTVEPGANSDPSYLKFTWNLTMYSQSFITLKLHFETPSKVSLSVNN